MLSQKHQTFPLLSSFTRTNCHLMLLISRVSVDLCIEFGQQYEQSKYKALNQWSWWSASRLSAASEDTAALVQLIMAVKLWQSIASDGRSNVQRQLIMNFMLVTWESALMTQTIYVRCCDQGWARWPWSPWVAGRWLLILPEAAGH